MAQKSCKSRQRCSVTVARSQASLLGPDGPCKGVGSPNGWYTVPQQPGICMNRPALETIPPWLRNPANHDNLKGLLSRSQASLLGPDGPCTGVGSPNGWYTVPQPGICMNRPARETIPPRVRNSANHDKGTLSRSQASLLGPDGHAKV